VWVQIGINGSRDDAALVQQSPASALNAAKPKDLKYRWGVVLLLHYGARAVFSYAGRSDTAEVTDGAPSRVCRLPRLTPRSRIAHEPPEQPKAGDKDS
jgi:hypothetical protein